MVVIESSGFVLVEISVCLIGSCVPSRG